MWITGKIIIKTGPLSYKVEIGGVIHRRHVDQMLPFKAQVMITDKSNKEDVFLLTSIDHNLTPPKPAPEQITHCNPPRRPPDRLDLIY